MFFEVKLFWYIDLTRFYEKKMKMGYEQSLFSYFSSILDF